MEGRTEKKKMGGETKLINTKQAAAEPHHGNDLLQDMAQVGGCSHRWMRFTRSGLNQNGRG